MGRTFNGEPHEPGNGQMIAFLASSRFNVQRVHELAIAPGGKPEGEPGLRPHYHANYFGTYSRDTEGNKICVPCHAAEAP